MFSLIFLIVLEWPTWTACASSRKGIQWTYLTTLEGLKFADDLTLLPDHLQDMQDKVKALAKATQQVD